MIPLLVEPRVVDRERGATRQVLRQPEILFVVVLPGFGPHHRERADDLPAGDQRDVHDRAQLQPFDDVEELGILDVRRIDHRLRDLRDEFGHAGAHHIGDARGIARWRSGNAVRSS